MDPTDLTPELIVSAYTGGYFPMAEPGTGEIHWYRPDPRAILPLEQFHVSRSLKKAIAKPSWRVSYDEAFLRVMKGCANRPETWMSESIFKTYFSLHEKKLAHSVEVWREENLVGGVYGVSLNGAFFAESKFHTVTDASKIALYYLVERLKQKSFALLEVQFLTDHLSRLGAVEVSDRVYQKKT